MYIYIYISMYVCACSIYIYMYRRMYIGLSPCPRGTCRHWKALFLGGT